MGNIIGIAAFLSVSLLIIARTGLTVCAMCDGKGRIDMLDNEPCAFCNGTGKYSSREDKEAIAMLDQASVEKEANAGDMAQIADYWRMTKRRV